MKIFSNTQVSQVAESIHQSFKILSQNLARHQS